MIKMVVVGWQTSMYCSSYSEHLKSGPVPLCAIEAPIPEDLFSRSCRIGFGLKSALRDLRCRARSVVSSVIFAERFLRNERWCDLDIKT